MSFNDMVTQIRNNNNSLTKSRVNLQIEKNEKTEEYLSQFPDKIWCSVGRSTFNLIKDTSYGIYYRSDREMMLDDEMVYLAVVPSNDGGRSKKMMDFILQDEGGGELIKETRKVEQPNENYMRYEVEQFLRPLVENDGLRI